MRTNRILSIAAALGAVLCLEAAGKVIPEYANEFETLWFDAGVKSYTAGQALPTQWKKPASADAEVTVGPGKITLDTDLDDPLTYTPENACSNVAVVAATMTATVNASEPTFTTAPQAALAAIGTSTSTNWVGLVGNGNGGTTWVRFPSPVPDAGETYSVRIEFDQRAGEARQIRYLVEGTVLGDGWYPNPQAGTAKISNVSFSGSGDITALSGKNVLNASFDMTDVAGFDFTNGVVKVSNVDVGGVAATAKIKVIDCKTGAEVGAYAPQPISGSNPVSWDLAAGLTDNALVPGGAYTYEVDILVGDEVVAKKTDTFLAANWSGSTWFGADASKEEAEREIGGNWDSAKAPEEVKDNAYVIEEDALFNVSAEKKDEGTNTVTRVDAVVTFDAFVTAPTPPEGGDAFGGFVAAKSGDVAQWMALTTDGWVALTGAAAPELQTTYTVRAEVDFLSAVKRVRYFVKTGTAEQDAFVPLACGDSEWIQLAVDKDTFTSVEFQGSGTLAKFEATIADKAVAEVNGKKYDTMAEALAAAGTEGTNTIKLLTNATFEPTQAGSYDIAPNNYRYASGGRVLSNPQTIVITNPDEPPVVRPGNQVMAEVKTPGGAQYKNINSLREFLEGNKVDAYTTNGSSGDIEKALETPDTNGLTYWQDYALGIDVGTSVAPVTVPTGDTADDGIMLSIPAIGAATPSGDYGLLFKVVDEKSAEKASTANAGAIKVPLATGTYKIKVIFTPAN